MSFGITLTLPWKNLEIVDACCMDRDGHFRVCMANREPKNLPNGPLLGNALIFSKLSSISRLG